VKNVDHTGHTSVFTKSHDTLTVCIHHFLVVDQSDVLEKISKNEDQLNKKKESNEYLFQHRVQQRHVGFLSLDCMGEETVCLVG
jgi:hypothetical protein